MKLRSYALVGTAALALAATPASAAELILGGGWQTFQFSGAGSSWDDDFTFTLTDSAEVRVTDAFIDGDQFEVFINMISQGLTSIPTTTGSSLGSDYDAAFADAGWSSGSYLLGPGSYTVSGIVAQNAPGTAGGGAAIQLLTAQMGAVPEPSTWLMLILGFGLVGFGMRSKNVSGLRVSYS